MFSIIKSHFFGKFKFFHGSRGGQTGQDDSPDRSRSWCQFELSHQVIGPFLGVGAVRTNLEKLDKIHQALSAALAFYGSL